MWTITEHESALPAILGGLAAIAHAVGEPGPEQRAWIEEVARRHGAPQPAQTLESWEVTAVAEALPEADDRRWLVRHQVLVALADARLDPKEIERVEAFARGLSVREPAVATLRTFAGGRTRALGMQLMRRSFLVSLMKTIWREEGLRGAWRIFKSIVRLRDRAKAARYGALGDLPEGTLGRVLYDHCRANEFALPGERRGTPEILLFHDVGHALTGHGADGLGEVQMSGFEAGFMGRDDAYSIALVAMYAFGVGAQIIPDFPTHAGDFQVEAFVAAYARGEALDRDLRFWDPWSSMDRPVAEVCRELGLVVDGDGGASVSARAPEAGASAT